MELIDLLEKFKDTVDHLRLYQKTNVRPLAL